MSTALPDWAQNLGFVLNGAIAGLKHEPNFELQIGPLWYRQDGDSYEFLLQIEQRHLNYGGIAHGAMLAALTDMVCSSTYWNHAGRPRHGFVTISLTHEFVGSAPKDSWLLSRCRIRQDGGSLVFVDCEMFVEDKLVGLSRCVMKKLKRR